MQAKKIMLQHKNRLFDCRNVVGVGIGNKIVKGERTKEPAVMVMVQKKVSEKELDKKDRVPKKLKGFITDVIEVGEVIAFSDRKDRVRPAVPGVSIGHYKVSAGTFGAVVKDAKNNELYILSNNHVLANVTNGKDGRANLGDEIYQPGIHDGGNKKNDLIGHLNRIAPVYLEDQTSGCHFAASTELMLNNLLRLVRPDYKMEIKKKTGRENLVDAALAKPLSRNLINKEIIGLGSINGTKEASSGMNLQKSGRTTGLTTGTVRSIDSIIRVNMGGESRAIFKEQIIASPMAQPGDSGSIVLDNDNNAVGLLFAGSDKATVINPINAVLKSLDIVFP